MARSENGTKLKLGLAPVIHKDSRILILGTMPGDDSIRLQQYYGHRNNQFWKILSEVYGEPIDTDYSRQLEFLRRRKLGLWDVLRSAEREGSLDSSIKVGIGNDFASIFGIATGLKALVFNGGKAQQLFQRHVAGQVNIAANWAKLRLTLPSTSPTPGRNVLGFEAKVARWKALTTI